MMDAVPAKTSCLKSPLSWARWDNPREVFEKELCRKAALSGVPYHPLELHFLGFTFPANTSPVFFILSELFSSCLYIYINLRERKAEDNQNFANLVCFWFDHDGENRYRNVRKIKIKSVNTTIACITSQLMILPKM